METLKMKYAAALALCASLIATSAFADSAIQPMPVETVVRSVPVVTPQGQDLRDVPSATTPRYSNSSQTFFGRLMELERRKNAWLRRQFLGR